MNDIKKKMVLKGKEKEKFKKDKRKYNRINYKENIFIEKNTRGKKQKS